MTTGASESLRLDAIRALRGVGRLVRFNPAWSEDFHLDRLGFYRSFFAQALRLPLILVFNLALVKALGERVVPAMFWQVGVSALFSLLLYMAASLVAVRALKLKGWLSFINVLNWGDFAFSVIIAALSLVTLAGPPGLTAVKVIWLVLIIPLQIMFIWRTSQETLQTDVSSTVLMVVLNLAASVLGDQGAAWLLPG